jgi:hypothetical protein
MARKYYKQVPVAKNNVSVVSDNVMILAEDGVVLRGKVTGVDVGFSVFYIDFYLDEESQNYDGFHLVPDIKILGTSGVKLSAVLLVDPVSPDAGNLIDPFMKPIRFYAYDPADEPICTCAAIHTLTPQFHSDWCYFYHKGQLTKK